MSETVMAAFERLAREYLSEPEVAPVMGDRTEISVTHHGEAEALRQLEDAHAEAILSNWTMNTRELTPGVESDETLIVTEANFVLGCDPHEEYVTGGAGASVSGSESSGSASPEARTDAEETATTTETTPARPDPSREMSQEAGGIRHVLAANQPGAEDQHLCETPLREAEYEGSIPDLYDDLLGAIADPMLCDACEGLMVDYYGIREVDVDDRREQQYD